MTKPVTVGIPFHNAERFIRSAIRSVFAQTTSDWELLLVDDGSSDRSRDIAQSVRDRRVRVVSDGNRRGLARRLNEITAMAAGPFVARMDADDIMHPDRLAAQIASLKSRPDIDVCASLAISINVDRDPIGIRGAVEETVTPTMVFKDGLFVHPTIMFRREWALSHPYSEKYPRAEDRHLWCSSFDHMRYQLLDRPLMYYREPDESRLTDHLRSTKSNRRIIADAGRRYFGRATRIQLLLRSLLGDVYHRGAAALGLYQLATTRRYEGLSTADVRSHAAVLQRIEETDVPGLVI